ncbi:RNA polymerase sigma factor RpoS [Aquisphaera giovannonii]|uniref:RNA polymerase sigma factor RpoS n=1 Tax=Aquisphaera giovannonii TaxID=406548 RepID=A0A5B9W7C8_9BACT|nr:RNA polymerase sigma factor RpoD/SigA [Aquisphaera giovannonii]QEH35921.1 RNA polymerase sigma factor RpoS [Aquisphaera giovannonii]
MFDAATKRTFDSTRIYDRDMRKSVRLSAEEERRLGEAVAGGDRDARSRLVEANLRLVAKIAGGFRNRGMDYEDLIGEGNLGLIRAAEGYDPRFGTRFGTYASHWIKQAIRAALINNASTIRLPAHMHGLLARWRTAEQALRRELDRKPSLDEVAARMGLSKVQKGMVEKAQKAGRIRLESGLNDDGEAWNPDDTRDGSTVPGGDLERADELDEFQRRMGRLDDRERTVLALRFGLEGNVPQTLTEIGRQMGVTREWIRRIERRAVDKLSREETGGASDARPPVLHAGHRPLLAGPSRSVDGARALA